MVEHSQKVLRERDRKERELKQAKGAAVAMNLCRIDRDKRYEKLMREYTEWKKLNGVEGIEYP